MYGKEHRLRKRKSVRPNTAAVEYHGFQLERPGNRVRTTWRVFNTSPTVVDRETRWTLCQKFRHQYHLQVDFWFSLSVAFLGYFWTAESKATTQPFDVGSDVCDVFSSFTQIQPIVERQFDELWQFTDTKWQHFSKNKGDSVFKTEIMV